MKKNLLGISLLTMTCLYGLLFAVVFLIFILFDLPILYAVYISIIVLLIQYFISPFFTDLTMKWLYKAKFDHELPTYVMDFIKVTCEKYKMKLPRLGFIDDGTPNAFTYGRTKNSARIILTRGLFDLLTEEEVKSVVAHEMGHAKHYDTLFITMAQLVPLVLYAIYETFISASDDNSNNGVAVYIGYIAYILYVISQFIVLKLSRTREYYADAFSLEETKNPSALASALVKIGYGLSGGSDSKKHKVGRSNCLGVFDSKSSKSLIVSSYENGMISKNKVKTAMKWEMWNPWASIYELYSTHPLISKRLDAISKRCPEFNQEPYIKFDLEKPESYVDDFAFEVFLWMVPNLILIATLVLSATSMMVLIHPAIPFGIGLIAYGLSLFLRLRYSHKDSGYKETKVSDLLGEVKVSNIKSVPCIIKGEIIGRGTPGYVLSEDLVIKDDTGIMLLDYNQPLTLINKLFALFKANQYMDKTVIIKGWYRRNPVPYVEIYTIQCGDDVKTVHTFKTSKVLYSIIIGLGVLILFLGIKFILSF